MDTNSGCLAILAPLPMSPYTIANAQLAFGHVALRDHADFFAMLSACASGQAGQTVRVAA